MRGSLEGLVGVMYPMEAKRGRNPAAGQIDHPCFKTHVAVRTGVGIRRRRVVMRQTSEEHNNEHCNNGRSLHWEFVLNAPIWVLEPHRAL